MPATVLEHARRYAAAGLSVIPVKGDGSKEPALPPGDPVLNRKRRATDEEISQWFGNGFKGVGVLGGPVSGDFEVIDVDVPEVFAPWRELVEAEAPGLLARLTVNKTPGGWHVCYRCPGAVEGNQILAREPDPADPARWRKTVETRGSGGYVLAPGCPLACHDSGRPYEHKEGPSLADVATITAEERSVLFDAARALSTWAPPPVARPPVSLPGGESGDRPGDLFNERGTWEEAFGSSGWTPVRPCQSVYLWRRPGKTRGVSGTTGFRSNCGKDLFHCFTSSAAPFEPGKSYDRFAVFAWLHHKGNWGEAARALLEKGYGEASRPAGSILVPTVPAATPAVAKLQAVVGQQMQAVEYFAHDDLLDADLPPLRWVVEGLVPDEGLTLIGGKKKLGKSWLCLQMAQAVASGGRCLDRPVSAGRVVYVCLEDGKRRLRARLIKQHAKRGLDVVYVTRFPKIDNADGMGKLMELIEKHRPRLLIIDTLAAAKTGKVEENAAGPMGDLGNTLRAIAQHYRLGMAATHHHGKLIGGDPGDDLRGSSALAAAADVNLGLYKGENGYSIKGEGRDIDAINLPVVFDAHGGWDWRAAGPAAGSADKGRSLNEARIIEALRKLPDADADSVAELAGLSRQTANDHLRILAEQGVAVPRILPSTGRGRPRIVYRLAGTGSGNGA